MAKLDTGKAQEFKVDTVFIKFFALKNLYKK